LRPTRWSGAKLGSVLEKARIWGMIRTIAAGQQGHITRAQLLQLGLGRRAIAYRIEIGELIVVHAGVYAVGYRRLDPLARAAAAVLACGEGAALSHFSAAHLWGMRERWPDAIEVTTRTDRRRPGIWTHRSRTLSARDVRRHHGIPVTSPARTALDIAPRLTPRQLIRAVNDGRLAGYLHRSDLEELLGRLPHHPGARGLRRIDMDTGPTRSALEDAFIRFANRFALPTPQINAHVAGYEVDVLFPHERVIVELDSWDFHRDRGAFESDRERDAATLAADHVTVRMTWARIHQDPEREAARLQEILRERRRRQAA
jgi:very-short-patch-repair endonuclease